MDDTGAWLKYPRHRHWFNKLELSLRLGYDCGPGGVAPTTSGYYVVRPIYNLSGMGVGARRQYIEAGDLTKVEPGYFWCEWFSGPHLSTDYEWDGERWAPLSTWQGINDPENLSRFLAWERRDTHPELTLPASEKLSDVGVINVEYIGLHPIEVHLRPSPPLPSNVRTVIPVWQGEQPEPSMYVSDYDDADGFITEPRIGFIIIP